MSRRPRVPHWSDPPFARPVAIGHAFAPNPTASPKARRKAAKDSSPATSAKKPTKQAAKTPRPARGTTKSKPAKKAKRLPTLRQQMIIAILRRAFPDGFTTDDIAGKTGIVCNGWKAECKAPLGNAEGPVSYEVPDRMTVTRTIRNYLERPEAYQRRR